MSKRTELTPSGKGPFDVPMIERISIPQTVISRRRCCWRVASVIPSSYQRFQGLVTIEETPEPGLFRFGV